MKVESYNDYTIELGFITRKKQWVKEVKIWRNVSRETFLLQTFILIKHNCICIIYF